MLIEFNMSLVDLKKLFNGYIPSIVDPRKHNLGACFHPDLRVNVETGKHRSGAAEHMRSLLDEYIRRDLRS